MDHYSEQIRIREQSEKAAAGQAETYLLGKDRGDSSCPGGETDEMMVALEYLFRRFRLPFDMGQKYETVPELLDCVLEPAGILYEEIDRKKSLRKGKANTSLLFRKAATAWCCRPPYPEGFSSSRHAKKEASSLPPSGFSRKLT